MFPFYLRGFKEKGRRGNGGLALRAQVLRLMRN